MLKKPEMKEGETYIGAIVDSEGSGNHIILLPGDNDDATWKKQMAWAKSIGGDLPTRAEQNLLFEAHKDQFKPAWYWSNQQHAEFAGYAWYQNFDYGYQCNYTTNNKLRARAVRRVAI